MTRMFALLLLCAATPATAQLVDGSATTQAALPEPSTEAMALAQSLSPTAFLNIVLRDRGSEIAHWEDQLSRTFTTKGPPCDRSVPACKAALEKVATDAADDLNRIKKATIVRGYAALFDRKMTKAEIRSAMDYIRTPGGRLFVRTLLDLANCAAPNSELQQLWMQLALQPSFRPSAYAEQFYDLTVGLPRTKLPAAPPPPTPPARGPK